MADERHAINEKSPWWGEHIHRYDIALEYVKGGEKILDLACGLGFGTHILAQNIEKRNPDKSGTEGVVIGGDIAQEAIETCRQYWQKDNLQFKVLDGTALPFNDNHFDIITSFETIEHTTQYMEMLKEFKRVLKINGLALISTPNFIVNSPSGKVENPYHTQEFTYTELETILQKVFSRVQIFGQKYRRYENKTLMNRVGAMTEKLLLQRGVRQIPISIQDRIMHVLIGKPIHPIAADFTLVSDKKAIEKCTTFVAICQKTL